ncbi:hypothetical protein L210DRAFT_3756579 [Boletus edulis BED1]|uniref:PB1 domain-containing protein n=1 Tax=Boletus edulis BED1 TaxID=1328754 RepID=A0AAD4C478_BOLED|nr:hypothetical protein L210DRAFT_3756579 [Boletus edulis BED1]
MSLSLKAELELWAVAVKAYDEQDFAKSLGLFSRIADSSKILTNMGLIYATIGEHEIAVEHFIAATNLDPFLAIAHFQCGVSNFLLRRYDIALLNFEDAYLYLRGNEAIDYDQLGLKFKLFSAEIEFNKGLAQVNLGYVEQGMADMQEASRLKVTDEHSVIDEAIQARGEGYTVFSIPVGVLYRPSENKLKNSKSKDYLGKAKLVAARDSKDAFTEFTGVKKLQQISLSNFDKKENENNQSKPDVDSSGLSRSATMPVLRTDPVAVLERAETIQPGAGSRPDAATILTSRRSQPVSNPVNLPPPPFASDLSRNNTAIRRSNTTRLARSATTNVEAMPLRAKTPQPAGGGAGIGADSSRVGREAGTLSALRSSQSLRRVRGKGPSSAAQQSPVQPLPQAPQQPRYVNATQNVAPFVLPAVPALAQEGHLTQFYNTLMDAYTVDQASGSAISRPPTAHAQRQSPQASSFYQQPQPQPQVQQQLPAWMESAPSTARSSSNTSSSSGMSRAPSRAANAGLMNANPNMGMGMGGADMGKGTSNNAGGTLRRKVTRRPTMRRVTVYDDEDGDDGFVTGEYDEFEMANIRVKLHYQDDVRGMTVPPTTSFEEFVKRVTVKFGTSLTGLGMKFMDEEGTKISLRDESDFELAIETARENAKGRSDGKMEVWCVDM